MRTIANFLKTRVGFFGQVISWQSSEVFLLEIVKTNSVIFQTNETFPRKINKFGTALFRFLNNICVCDKRLCYFYHSTLKRTFALQFWRRIVKFSSASRVRSSGARKHVEAECPSRWNSLFQVQSAFAFVPPSPIPMEAFAVH